MRGVKAQSSEASAAHSHVQGLLKHAALGAAGLLLGARLIPGLVGALPSMHDHNGTFPLTIQPASRSQKGLLEDHEKPARAPLPKSRTLVTLNTQPWLRRTNAANPKRAGAMPRAGLVWMRNDLRLHDHEALAAAAAECSCVVPVYCFDPREYGKVRFWLGKEQTGSAGSACSSAGQRQTLHRS